MEDHLGDNFIFILSQPRTGSTLLTRLLENHAQIDALGEPRIMQTALMTIAKRWNEPDSLELKHSRQDVDIFLNSFPQGKKAYIHGMRKMFTHIYNERLKHTDKNRFLDKTPRYAYFIPELYETFPRAKYIFLFRHPLAVLSSIARNWSAGKPPRPRDDLDVVPELLLEGRELLGDQAITVHYESLVTAPQETLQSICEYLELPFEDSISNYNAQNKPWETGDQIIYTQKGLSIEAMNAWKDHLKEHRLWTHSIDYLNFLGKDCVEQMGYDFDETMHTLEAKRPNSFKRLVSWLLRHV